MAVKPPETFDEMLFRTEAVQCKDLTLHDDGAPIPDCAKIYAAFKRGQARVAKLYPKAVDIKMSALSFWQGKIHFNEGEAFPRVENGSMAFTVNTLIQYAFEETIEHETTHALVYLLDGLTKRTEEAIDNPKDADQKDLEFIMLYQITCHNTSDDPFGDGTSLSKSGRAGCILPYVR